MCLMPILDCRSEKNFFRYLKGYVISEDGLQAIIQRWRDVSFDALVHEAVHTLSEKSRAWIREELQKLDVSERGYQPRTVRSREIIASAMEKELRQKNEATRRRVARRKKATQ